MPNRNQIIIISVLGIAALLIGYFKNPLNLSMGKRAEVQGPIAPTIVTNVITNLANNIVTNVIANTVPVQPKPNPVKPRTISRKDIVGTYEWKNVAYTIRRVFLANGISEYYKNGKKRDFVGKWSIVNNEIHIEYSSVLVIIYNLNPDNSISHVARIDDGKRTDNTKVQQQRNTYKKIKQPQPTRTLTLQEKDIVGTYERKSGSNTDKWVFLENGIREYYNKGNKKGEDHKWSLIENEIHTKHPNNNLYIYRINPDNSITLIAGIRDEKRTDYSKEQQTNTWINIK